VERNTLALVDAVSSYRSSEGRDTVTREGHFLDLVVDGVPLRSRLAGGEDHVTNLNASWRPEAVAAAVQGLRGLADSAGLPPHVVPLIVCKVCGDLGCGGWVAKIDVDEQTVSWTGFRWTDWSVGTDVEAGEMPTTDLATLVFERQAYEAALADAVERVQALPHPSGHTPDSKRRWPWAWGWRLPKREAGSID
jgi:hypothetical protein